MPGRNPFENLGKPQQKINLDWEEAEGRFGCFKDGCGKVTGQAWYNESEGLLKWACPAGHENEIEYDL